jgi:molybdenum cofactor cytidylyltransferase
MNCAIRTMAEASRGKVGTGFAQDAMRHKESLLVAVLAAGLGSRFGGGKLDADCAGKPLGQWALEAVAAAGLAPGVIVCGPAAPAFALASGWRILTNPAPEAGLGGSAALAARAALAEGRALLLLLADMPLIAPAHLAALAAHPGPAATRYGDGYAGVPALLPLAMLPEAGKLSGMRGAGELLAEASLVDAPDGTLHDVDNAADLAAVAARLRRG